MSTGMYEGAIQDLIDALGRLPGIGPKSAQRIAFHILQSDADIAAALVDAIKSGKVWGAAVDVFPYEPKTNDEEFINELRGLPNVILTPHIGGSTEEAQANIGEFVPAKLLQFMNNGSTYGSVNFPELQLPPLENAHRLLHIHHNVPGILAQINNVFAKYHVNIIGQYLKTTEKTGYVITDVAKEYSEEIVNELKLINDTIKFRMLY